MAYRMISDSELRRFRKFMTSGIPLDYFGPDGAYDSSPRRARDQEGEEPEEEPARRGNFMRLLKICARGMTPESWAQFQRDLLDGDEDDGAQDEPPDCVGRPKTGGEISGGGQGEPKAMDRRAYDSRFPDSARVAAYPSERAKPAVRASRRFHEMFPDAPK